MLCHCGSQIAFAQCCEPYLTHKEIPPTPEALMRSRYSAYVTKNHSYVMSTMTAEVAEGYEEDGTENWLEGIEWVGLNVFKTSFKTPTVGYVSFDAVYTENGKTHHICEKSEFHKSGDRWIYVGGKAMNPAGRSPVATESKK